MMIWKKSRLTKAAGVLIVIAVALMAFVTALSLWYPGPSKSCQRYSCVYIRMNSNSSITGISVSLSPTPASCAQTKLVCTPGGPDCIAPSNFCANVNTFRSTYAMTFQGVKQGYYWLDFNANLGNGASQGMIKMIYVANETEYYVTANMTAELATIQISITP